MKTLIVPTIRQKNLGQFLDAWKPLQHWDKVIVVEDNPEKTFSLNEPYIHYCWKDIEETLKEESWIISRRDSAIRSFGFLMAYKLGTEFFYTLDDDCLPFSNPQTFVDKHLESIQKTTKWVESIPNMRTRGLPYRNLGSNNNVVLNMGLWSNVADLDAIQTLSQTNTEYFKPPLISHIMPYGQYFPICGMNLCFTREFAPLSYFPLMGLNSPYRRFDDIWFGIIAKKICDYMGMTFKVGTPFVNHSRASDPFINLTKEAPGIAFNEIFWEIIDRIELKGKNPKECLKQIGDSLITSQNEYLFKLGSALQIWCNYF